MRHNRAMHRRSFVPLVVAVLAGCSSHAASTAGSATIPSTSTVPEVRSRNGVVSFSLDAVIDPKTKAPAFEYDGQIGVTPTIRVQPGEAIHIVVHNRMPAGQTSPDFINLHFHGLTVSPDPPSDDAMRDAAPGASIVYDVRIARTQPPGLYWYHPHVHGSTYWQITSGMSGALVVEGLQTHLPALARMRERILVLRNVQTDPDIDGIPIVARPAALRDYVIAGRRRAGRRTAIDDDDAAGLPCAPLAGMQTTLDGRAQATLGIDPGERQLFRVVNATAGRYYDLHVDGEELQLVAIDGVPLDAAPGAPAARSVSHYLLAPAARAEFVVTGQSQPAKLASSCYTSGDAGDRDPAVTLATLRSDGHAPAGSDVDPLSAGVRPLAADTSALPVPVADRHVDFTENADGFYINNHRYVMGEPPSMTAHTGSIERWTLRNFTAEVHDFHIHQVHFLVESIDGKPASPPYWADTVTVPPAFYPHRGVTPGTVVVLMDFRNPVIKGTFLYHCHILDHEDGGMMASIRVL
ncbi:MAG TPA: multicopper oxidase family protein [Candidatus Tumulicola sp.]